MHNEKNVLDNVFNILMNVKKKLKDHTKARQDIRLYCNGYFDIEISEGKGSKPTTCYILTKDQKKIVLDWVKEFKLPNG